MQIVNTPGGLAGKARSIHKRNRTARLHADQLVAEYLEGDLAEARRERYVPIRGRNEFLPSVTVAQEAATGNLQLELPLIRQGAMSASKADMPPAAERAVAQRGAEPATSVAVCFPRTTKPSTSPALKLKPPEQFTRKQDFTIGGFVFGCVMGSAAAALVLLVVHIAVG